MTRDNSCFAKIAAVVFSGVVAPVLVDVTLREIRSVDARARGNRQESAPRAVAPDSVGFTARVGPNRTVVVPAARPATNNVEVTEVIAHGVGPTPNEALRDALRTALHHAVAAHADAAALRDRGPTLYEHVIGNGNELIRNWKEIGGSKQWRLRGTLYQREVAVEVNHEVLMNRLFAAQTRTPAEARP
jgi:hypothetical protein